MRRFAAWCEPPGARTTARNRLARIIRTIETLVDYPHVGKSIGGKSIGGKSIGGRSIGRRPARIAATERHRIIYAATHSAAGNIVVILRTLGRHF